MKLRKVVEIKNHSVIVDGQIEKSIEDKSMDFKRFAKQIYTEYGIKYSKFHKMDNLCKLGLLCSYILLKDIDLSAYQPDERALILANASASLNTDNKYQKTISEIPSPSVFVYTLPNIVGGEISIKNDFKGESMFLVSQAFDTDFFFNYSRYLIEKCKHKVVVMGWVEMDMNENYKAFLYLIEDSEDDTFMKNDLKIKQ